MNEKISKSVMDLKVVKLPKIKNPFLEEMIKELPENTENDYHLDSVRYALDFMNNEEK